MGFVVCKLMMVLLNEPEASPGASVTCIIGGRNRLDSSTTAERVTRALFAAISRRQYIHFFEVSTSRHGYLATSASCPCTSHCPYRRSAWTPPKESEELVSKVVLSESARVVPNRGQEDEQAHQ